MLQKQETKQFQDLALKAQFSREQQEKKFEQEMMVCTTYYLLIFPSLIDC